MGKPEIKCGVDWNPATGDTIATVIFYPDRFPSEPKWWQFKLKWQKRRLKIEISKTPPNQLSDFGLELKAELGMK